MPSPQNTKHQALARNLAASLAQAMWTEGALENVLQRRLPPDLHLHAPTLAADLIAAFPKPYAPTAARIASHLGTHTAIEEILRYCVQRKTWPDEDLTPPSMHPAPAFRDLPLPDLPTEAALADWLLLTPAQLTWFADAEGRAARADDGPLNHYFPCLLSKPSGGHRLIEAPKPALKALQRRILKGLLDIVPPHPAAHGFTKGRSCLTSAAIHAGEAVVLRFDIRDFFPSITAARIHALFRCLGYPHTVARALTGLTTTVTHPNILTRLSPTQRRDFARPHLPQGAPTSPALANLAAFKLDRRLSGLARSRGASYTRYADDLAFSGDAEIALGLLKAVPRILAEEGFAANPGKTRVMPRAQRQSLTGLSVNAHVNLPRREFDRIKAAIDQLENTPGSIARTEGRLQWAEAASPSRGRRLRERFNARLLASR